MSESKEQKINEILKNALKVLAKNGYENTTIANIATESGVSRGILHYYFVVALTLHPWHELYRDLAVFGFFLLLIHWVHFAFSDFSLLCSVQQDG